MKVGSVLNVVLACYKIEIFRKKLLLLTQHSNYDINLIVVHFDWLACDGERSLIG